MKRYFLNLSDDELIKKIEGCNKKIAEYEKPIKEYDKHLKIFKETKNGNHEDNPIVLHTLLNLKITPSGESKYIMLKDVYFEEINYFQTINGESVSSRVYLLNKGGNRFFYTEMMDHWVKNKRQMENNSWQSIK